MRRALITSLASMVAVVVIAPAAHAATQIRHFQGNLSLVRAPPSNGGQVGLDVVFKNKRESPRKFTPRQLIAIEFIQLPVTCSNAPRQSGTAEILTTTVQTQARFEASPPASGRPKPGRYSFHFATVFTGISGTIAGKLFKRNGAGEVLANGVLTIEQLDFPDSGPTNCSTTGQRGWSARTEARPPTLQ
jgi:hypothetical protein